MTLLRDNQNIHLAWATPIFDRKWTETAAFNQRLRKIILEREGSDEGVRKSVVGGWHSTEDLLSWPHPEMQRLVEMIKEAVIELSEVTSGLDASKSHGDATFIGWANVLRNGGYNKVHTHPGCVWSGVYYVSVDDDVAEPVNQGQLEFHDPRPAVEMVPSPGDSFGQPMSFSPEEGRMFAFPAWLRHGVSPYLGDGERISIAFNVRIDAFFPDG